LGFFDDPIGAVALVLAWLLVLVLFWWLALPLLLLVLDVLVLVPLLLLGGLVKVLLRRPWRVEAVRPGPGRAGARHTVRDEVAVAGWRRALRARDGNRGIIENPPLCERMDWAPYPHHASLGLGLGQRGSG
jgi:hypothetical protein